VGHWRLTIGIGAPMHRLLAYLYTQCMHGCSSWAWPILFVRYALDLEPVENCVHTHIGVHTVHHFNKLICNHFFQILKNSNLTENSI
jgi:hypothetical protein